MGRLLRKKVPLKKKKENDGEAPVAGVNAENGEMAPKADAPAVPAVQKKPVSQQPAKARTGGEPPKETVISKSLQFLREVRVELKRVTWPSRQQAMGSTVVVMLVVMVVSLFLGAVDWSLSNIILMVLR